MRLTCITAALVAACITTAHAATPIDGWYLGLFGGYTYVPSNLNQLQDGLIRTNASYNAGYDVGGSVGYKSTPMRYEGELTYLNANVDKFNINGIRQTVVSGYNSAFFTMANVYYDAPNLLDMLQPFVGLGIGYGWVSTQFNSAGPYYPSTNGNSNNAFSYQVTGGLTYNFSENYALNLGYRYIGTTHIDALNNTFDAQMASLGAVYRFDIANYK